MAGTEPWDEGFDFDVSQSLGDGCHCEVGRREYLPGLDHPALDRPFTIGATSESANSGGEISLIESETGGSVGE